MQRIVHALRGRKRPPGGARRAGPPTRGGFSPVEPRYARFGIAHLVLLPEPPDPLMPVVTHALA
jgi:hypothetical protein